LSRTLYVHVGPKKTGTSAIQHALRRHDNSVIIYPKVGLWEDGSHHGLVFKFFGEPRMENRVAGDIDGLFAEIEKEAKDSEQNVLISSETLAKRDCEAFIRALLPHVASTSMDVEILVACREHFSRTSSLFNHKLRGGEPPDPDEFLRIHAAELCYAPLIGKLKKMPFRVVPLNYHPSETWVTRFLTHVGFPQQQIPESKIKRLALSPKAIVAKLAINNLGQPKDVKLRYYKRFEEMPESRAASKFIFGPDAAMAAEHHFSADREFLSRDCGIHLPAPELGTQENMLFINADEFSDIMLVAKELGPQGRKIIHFARQFLRA